MLNTRGLFYNEWPMQAIFCILSQINLIKKNLDSEIITTFHTIIRLYFKGNNLIFRTGQ